MAAATLTFEASDEVWILDTAAKEGPPWRFTVGRAGSNDVALSDLSVSERHLEIEVLRLFDGSLDIKLLALPTTNPTRIGALNLVPGRRYGIRTGRAFTVGAVQCHVAINASSAAGIAAGEEEMMAAGGTQVVATPPDATMDDDDMDVAPGATQLDAYNAASI
jgi:hypothetical protein